MGFQAYFCITNFYIVDMIPDNNCLDQREDLLSEIAVMKQLGKHPHIVELLGACTLRDPVMMLLEFMKEGCLHDYLR